MYVLIWLYPSLILGKFNEFATLLGVAEYWGCKSFRLWGLLSGFHANSLDVKLYTVRFASSAYGLMQWPMYCKNEGSNSGPIS